MRERATVRAVWDSDLAGLLSSLGLSDAVDEGTLHCEVCDRKVNLENLGTIFTYGNEIKVSCDRTSCVRSASALGSGSLASG